ncbi:MAG TPA: arsenate reductase ArsC [Candidatus Acidoferrales bacterium]|nr:arsenate reductase ArsC [Candidatus Acidoferrales bacterium]
MNKYKVLVLCTGNSARSQMAEGILRWLSKGEMEVHSAGTHPSQVHPFAIAVMKELGVDISGQRSKSVDEFKSEKFDTVITVCDLANESCPIFPGAPERIHFSFEDPAAAEGADEEKLKTFRRVRDELLQRLRLFLNTRQQHREE